MVQTPNLFNYATSELSQDALICWLSVWAASQYKEIDVALHQVSITFLQALLEKHRERGKEQVVFPLKDIVVKRQYKNIDVLIIIKDQRDSTFIILIEDKVGTGAHSGQLVRYYDTIIKNKTKSYNVDDQYLYPIYLNTHNVNHRLLPNSDKYAGFYRMDFLKVLETYKGDNAILNDFYQYLLNMEIETNLYKTLSKNSWVRRTWEGFFIALKEQLKMGNWSYVNNSSGGFSAFYFGGVPLNIQGEHVGSIYIQLQEDRLNIKLGLIGKFKGKNHLISRRKFRNQVYRELKESFGDSFRKPDNFGNGQDMTVLVYNKEYLETDPIDFERITKKLTNISELIKGLAERVIINGKTELWIKF